MNKKILWILVAALVLLSGCGIADVQTEVDDLTEPQQYGESSEVFRFSGEYCPLYLAGAGDSCFYFYQRTDWEDDGHAYWTTEFFRQAYSRDSEPESINISFENPFHTAFFVSAGEDGKDLLYLLMMEETDEGREYRIVIYTGDGVFREEIPLSDEALSDAAVFKLLPLGEDGFGILAHEKLFIVDRLGKTQAVFKCPEGSFQGMACISNDEMVVTYYDGESRSASLSVVEWNKDRMSEGCKIKGDGQLLSCEEGNICFMDTQAIYEMDPETKVIREKISLEGRNVFPDRTADMKVGDGETVLLCYGTDSNAVKYIVFSPEEENGEEETLQLDAADYDQYGRRFVYVYDYYSWTGEKTELGNIIDAFNEQSDSYQVVLKDYGYGNRYDEGVDPLKIITAEEFPDLIFSMQTSLIDIFREKDCLEDLTPYIESSENISVSDIVDPVLNAYSVQGKIYALPRTFQMETLMGKRSQMGEPGWTVDEFLSWIETHADMDNGMSLTKDRVYDLCMETLLDSCVDMESGEADFIGGTFKSAAVRINELNLGNGLQIPDPEEIKNPDSWYIVEAAVGNLGRAVYAEIELGEEGVFKGYPGKDGEPVYYFEAAALSIFRTSDVKEGAFEFLEYYLMYQGEDISGQYQNITPKLYTLKSYLEKGISLALQVESMWGEPCAVTQEQIDKVLALFPYVVPRKEKYEEIRVIVDEELQPFFDGQKDIDTVCEIIQSKVKIYLEESK
ncbi:MAG: extracellular solute-binding protein [Lachnospiraceae bacterium]|nr:extracellular solute-binding protein [Lachnospiraceae bacterium]